MRRERSTTTAAIGLAACVALSGCREGPIALNAARPPLPSVVTADIQTGIERYIAEQTRQGNGYFRFSSPEGEYAFKLVRIHTDYLATLGPLRHFACVDLVDTSGDVYDVDFFLAGPSGRMAVTETTLHKLNGIPFYAWKQTRKGVWKRVATKRASPKVLGVMKGVDTFDFFYRAKLPIIAASARMWIPLPRSDAFQTVTIGSIIVPGRTRTLRDHRHGNAILFSELGPQDSLDKIEIRYTVQRLEKAPYSEPDSAPHLYLETDTLDPQDSRFGDIVSEVVAGKRSNLVRARAIYDHVMERMRYIKYGEGWGKGDAVYACTARTGNCTDFHAYFIALARAARIPARFAIGAAIPSARDDGGVDGYHCWAEFYADRKWWPVDISEADKHASLATYYFGHHPANRIEFSRGRDLLVEPGPVSGPINFLAYPVLEIEGKPATVNVEFSFTRCTTRNSDGA